MQPITVAAVSMNSPLGKTRETMAAIADWCERAAEKKAELVLFPELVVHGHCTPNTWELAESVPDGPSVRRLEELARQYGLFLSVGLSEKQHDIVYNTQVLVGPEGYLGKQRKIHLSRDEVLFYKGGREMPVFDIGKCKIGTSICYDNQFPEVTRMLALHGAEIILMPHAARQSQWDDTPESQARARRHMFDYFRHGYTMRARENACFVVLADQAGRAGYVDAYPRDHPNQPHHPGAILFLGPGGELLSHGQIEEIRDEMVVAELDPALLAKHRGHPNYTLRTRRPELFGDLVKEQVEA